MKNYYEILGVKRNATQKEIQRAYRQLAIIYHPDSNPDQDTIAKMQELNEAYNTLGDEQSRIKYDFLFEDRISSCRRQPCQRQEQQTKHPKQKFDSAWKEQLEQLQKEEEIKIRQINKVIDELEKEHLKQIRLLQEKMLSHLSKEKVYKNFKRM